MSLAVNVLTATGRRQIVKVTPNTSVMQILDDVCNKQGFLTNEYNLKHHRRILSPSDTVRFANLPNNAQLELVRSEDVGPGVDLGNKQESRVTIGLQLESGERCLADFDADVTLWDILVHWNTHGKDGVLNVTDETGLVFQPVCVYMRKEVSGETELRKTSLRSLGLVSGKVIVRLLHRPQNVVVKQAFVEALNLKQQWTDLQPVLSGDSISSDEQINPSNLRSMSAENSIDYDVDVREKLVETSNDTVQKMETESAPSTTHVAASIPPISSRIVAEIDEGTVEDRAPVKLHYLDDKGSLLYNLEDVPKPFDDELPDQFFEVTMDDVRLLLGDLKRQREGFEDIPLKTSAMRESEFLFRLNRYPKSVIRVNFPDRLVLQGSFKATDKVEKIMDFVRSFLVARDLEFILYTTPLKRVLNPEERLFEIPLVPAAVVHFGCDTALDHYLIDDVMKKISSPLAANRVVLCNSDSQGTQEHSHKVARWTENNQNSDSTSSTPSTSDNPLCSSQERPSTSYSSRPRHEPSKGAIPKWFSMGKK